MMFAVFHNSRHMSNAPEVLRSVTRSPLSRGFSDPTAEISTKNPIVTGSYGKRHNSTGDVGLSIDADAPPIDI